jgi:hypothetical protein
MLVLDMGGQIDSISCIYWGGTELPIVSDSYASLLYLIATRRDIQGTLQKLLSFRQIRVSKYAQ